MTNTDVKVSRSRCRIGDNVYFLISEVYNTMVRSGYERQADEMQKEIDTDANSPGDVLKIVQRYVTLE